MKEKIVLCDFDGTVTLEDTIGLFLKRFADEKWHIYESLWRSGKIGSRECMRKQFDLIYDMNDEKLENFLNSIKIDESFITFYNLAKENSVDIAIVSDGFDYFINKVLKNYNLNDLKIFANHLEFIDGKFIMEFPHKNTSCIKKSGNCKCNIVNNYKKLYKTVFYAGDGVSDFCAADKADYLFAKLKLSNYCTEKNIPFCEYNTFDEVINNDRLGLVVRCRN